MSLQDAQVGELVLANLVAFPALYLAYQAMWPSLSRFAQHATKFSAASRPCSPGTATKRLGLWAGKSLGGSLGWPLAGQILIFGGLLEIVAVACLLVSGVLRPQLGVEQFASNFVLDERCRFFQSLGSSF